MHVHWRIQQLTTRVGAVTYWIEQPVSPKQVAGFTRVLNSEVDQLIRKFIVQRYADMVGRALNLATYLDRIGKVFKQSLSNTSCCIKYCAVKKVFSTKYVWKH